MAQKTNMIVAENLKQLRLGKYSGEKKSIGKVAADIGISYMTLYRYEKNGIITRISVANDICEYYGVPFSYLYENH